MLVHSRATWWRYPTTDLLIFVDNESMCQSLATFLGLVIIEGLVRGAKINVNIDEVLQLRTKNKGAKLYKLIQLYLNRKLMFGSNNICITSNYNLFKFIRSDAKAVMFYKSEYTTLINHLDYSNFQVEIQDTNFLTYVSAISEIVSKFINIKSSIDAIFFPSQIRSTSKLNYLYLS